VILGHAWPVSLRPICAVYGLAIGTLLSGSFVVEYVTAWPGLGRLMYEALRARDVYLVAGCAAMGGLFLATGSLISDVLLALVDPRIREAHTG
jgi:peptide/nickel transport system permease protein